MRKPPLQLQNGLYEVDQRIGAGCFGEVWRGRDTNSDEAVAVKFEKVKPTNSQLENEARTLAELAKPEPPQGFSRLHVFTQESGFNCMVMDILGPSLDQLQTQACGSIFSAQTATLVAEQLIQRIEYLHSKCIVHRDIKPENFVLGTGERRHHIFLIDFGLCKCYHSQGKHHPLKTNLAMIGTARYASINASKGLEQSRRDDLEAIAHMLIFFLRGSLPWSGLQAETLAQKYLFIRKAKESIPIDDLCYNLPEAFMRFLGLARSLRYSERPDYEQMRDIFHELRMELGPAKDHEFEWDDGSHAPRERLEARKSYRQPDDADEGPVRPGYLSIWRVFQLARLKKLSRCQPISQCE